jgi:hypothetical protein
MPKFKVLITAMAVVSQSQIIEADDIEDARYKATQPETYNNGVWDYCGVEGNTVECDDVEGGY